MEAALGTPFSESFTKLARDASFTQYPLPGLLAEDGPAVDGQEFRILENIDNLTYVPYRQDYLSLPLPGCLIVAEGVDGAGKTTALKGLATHLANEGYWVGRTKEPTPYDTSRYFRAMLRPGSTLEMVPAEELAALELDRTAHMLTHVLPALQAGMVLICDRFTDSTEVLQGDIGGIPLEAVQEFNRLATFGVKPDITLVLDIPVHEAVRRKQRRSAAGGAHDRNDARDEEYIRVSRDGFVSRGYANPKAVVINADKTPELVLESIKVAVHERLHHKLRKPHLNQLNPTAAVVLFHKDNVVLVRNKDPQKDQRLGYPGGKPTSIEAGTRGTARRETREEVGAQLEIRHMTALPQRLGAIVLNNNLQIATINPYLYERDIEPDGLRDDGEVVHELVPIWKILAEQWGEDTLLPNVREILSDALDIKRAKLYISRLKVAAHRILAHIPGD